MTALDTRPESTEHASFALTYMNATEAALSATKHTSVRALIESQGAALHALLKNVDANAFHRAYAPGKWTLAESLLHVADTERVFAYRLMRVARRDQTPLPGFNQDDWVPVSGASKRTGADILTEIDAVRAATIALVRTIDDETAVAMGTASGNPISVRALAWMIAGHFAHHLEITRTRYLAGG